MIAHLQNRGLALLKFGLNVFGIVVVIGVLLWLPGVGSGIAGWKGFAVSICAWLVYWRFLEWLWHRLDANPKASIDQNESETGAATIAGEKSPSHK